MIEAEPIEYISYNGLGRAPMIWGIPYMTGLFVMCFCLLIGMSLGVFVSPVGWAFTLIGIPILLFVKVISATDDKAVNILFLEMKWLFIKAIGGTSKYFGGTLTMSPISYGRRFKYVKRYFKAASSK